MGVQRDADIWLLLGAGGAVLAAAVGSPHGLHGVCCERRDRESQIPGESPRVLPASEGRKFDAARWAATLSRIKSGIVSLKVNSVRAFDTQQAGAGQATGFVVDSTKGFILTNRHVVTEGPVIAEALFDNHEDVQLRAVYRDPVHDFGIFQYDPIELHSHLPAGVAELQLRPDKAAQGLDVRVIGNNAGEKLSVLGAMLARLDREAPFYGRRTYNDFNTFYFQAASATSGGSSGSPVVDSDGDVIALNAGGKAGTSASFYLPLDRVKRALELLRAGRPVTRGTLQTTFEFLPFSELRRLGLTPAGADAARGTGESVGMLVVKSLVPRGPACGLLEPGDILISVSGERVTRFTPLEAILDEAVGRVVDLLVERGGKELKLGIQVQDLHSVVPSAYLECGNAVFTNLSYQQARQHNVAVDGLGVYVAAQGYMLRQAGIGAGHLITQIGEQPCRNIHELEAVLAAHPDGSRVPVQFMSLANPGQRSITSIRIDRTWFPMQLTTRDDPEPGLWSSRPSAPAPPPVETPTTGFGAVGGRTRYALGSNVVEKSLARSIVKVAVSVPLSIDGMPGLEFAGTGMVVDADRGLVVCDRNTAPGMLCDCVLTFGSSCTIPAQCVYIHPLHNLAVLSYNTDLVSGVGVEAVQLSRCSAHELEGKQLWHVTSVGSMRTGCKLISEQGTAMEIEPNIAPLPNPPRWQETNIDLLSFRSGASTSSSNDGIIADDEGRVVAYWASFLTQEVSQGRLHDGHYYAGITADTVEDMLQALREDKLPVQYALGAELEKLGLAEVRGVLLDPAATEEWEERCEHWPPQVMSVRRRFAGTDARRVLQDGDLLLEMNGKPVETFRDAEVAADRGGRASAIVVRGGVKLSLELDMMPVVDTVTDRIVLWGGAVLQKPPTAIASQRGQEQRGVYISSRFHGSPAARYNLPPMSRILEVDGEGVPDIDSFLRAVAAKRDGADVRIKHMDLRGAPSITCVRADSRYWPTTELRRVPGPRWPTGSEAFHWRRSSVTPSAASNLVTFQDLTESSGAVAATATPRVAGQ